MLIDPGCARVQADRALAWEEVFRALDTGEVFILERRGEPAGVLLPYEQWQGLTDLLRELSK
jgi:hypothetical protein